MPTKLLVAHPEFGSSVNPIKTRGADYALASNYSRGLSYSPRKIGSPEHKYTRLRIHSSRDIKKRNHQFKVLENGF